MHAADGELLTLRPEGFPLDAQAVNAYVQRIPGTYRVSDKSPWVIVVPASDMKRLMQDPEPKTPRILGPQYALVSVDSEKVEIHPGYTTSTWGCAQRLIKWLLGFGPWSIHGLDSDQEYDHGIIRSEDELFRTTYYDPQTPFQIPDDLTTSPPVVGELTSLLRYSRDFGDGHYSNVFVRVHDSGAFSCECKTHVDDIRWDGRLVGDFIDRWNSLVGELKFDDSSPNPEDEERDPVAFVLERPGEARRLQPVDARRPQPSFAPLVRLMDGWGRDLLDGKSPAELTDLRMSFPKDADNSPQDGAVNEARPRS